MSSYEISSEIMLQILEVLLVGCENKDAVVRYSASESLKNLAAKATSNHLSQILEVLIPNCTNKNGFVSHTVYEVLGNLAANAPSKHASKIIEELFARCKNNGGGCQQAAHDALHKASKKAILFKLQNKNENMNLPHFFVKTALKKAIWKKKSITSELLNSEKILYTLFCGAVQNLNSFDMCELVIKLFHNIDTNFESLFHTLENLNLPVFLSLLKIHKHYPQELSLEELLRNAKKSNPSSSNSLHELAHYLFVHELPLVIIANNDQKEGRIITPDGSIIAFDCPPAFKCALLEALAKERGIQTYHPIQQGLAYGYSCFSPNTPKRRPNSFIHWSFTSCNTHFLFKLYHSDKGNIRIQIQNTKNKLEALEEAFKACPSFSKRLDLSGNALEDSDVSFFCSLLPRFPCLRVLILDNNYITKNGLLSLLDILNQTHIHKLSLVNNWIVTSPHYFDKHILPYCNKTLHFLDLSINAIPKGYIYKNSDGFHEVLPEEKRKRYFEDQNKFKSSQNPHLFWQRQKNLCAYELEHHPALYNHIPGDPVESFLTTHIVKAEEKLCLTENIGVVALVATEHLEQVFFLIETLSQNQREFIRGDLYVKKDLIKIFFSYYSPKKLITELAEKKLIFGTTTMDGKKDILLQSLFVYQDQPGFETFKDLCSMNTVKCITWAIERLVETQIIVRDTAKAWTHAFNLNENKCLLI